MVSKQSGQPAQVLAAETGHGGRLRFQAADGARHIHRGEVGFDGLPVGSFRRYAAGLAHARRGRIGVSGGQRLIGKPGIRDEAAGAGGAHDVAAPERVDT